MVKSWFIATFINVLEAGKLIVLWIFEGRIIITSTPLFAKQVSSKLAYGSARDVQRDLGENHHRPVAVSYIQRISAAVASIIEAKEESWNYVPPKLDVEIKSVAIGLDGTCMLLCDTLLARGDGRNRQPL